MVPRYTLEMLYFNNNMKRKDRAYLNQVESNLNTPRKQFRMKVPIEAAIGDLEDHYHIGP